MESTLPETNIAPKNGWLEYDRFLGWPVFRGKVALSFREGIRVFSLAPKVCWGLNSHYFHMIVDGHQPKSVGVYRAPL